MENEIKEKFPKVIKKTIDIEGDNKIHIFSFIMGDTVHIYVYDELPKMGTLVAKPFSIYPDPPLVFYEGRQLPETVTLSHIISGKLRRNVVLSLNIASKTDIAWLGIEVAKKLMKEVQ